MASGNCHIFNFDPPSDEDDIVINSSAEGDKSDDENESPALPDQHSTIDTSTVQQNPGNQAVDPKTIDGIASYI